MMKLSINSAILSMITLSNGGCTEILATQDIDNIADNGSAASFLQPGAIACDGGIPFTMDGFKTENVMTYIEAPERDAAIATAPLMITPLNQLARSQLRPPLQKTYCQIGATRMVVEITYSVEDDAISHITQRAFFRWTAGESGAGWQIDSLGQKLNCARVRDKETNSCL